MSHCEIIAEAGVNHNGSIDAAYSLIDVAADCGVDYVKFQTFDAAKLVDRNALKADYQIKNSGAGESQYEMLKRLELPRAAFSELLNYSVNKGVKFLSTPFDIDAAYFLADLGIDKMKVSSGDLTNIPFLRELAKIGLPVILSTGMANLSEVEAAVETLESKGMPIDKLTILHCTTEYPAPACEVNLNAMRTLRCAFPGATIGYSDHTQGIAISLASVANGAQVLEKHFTLDRNLPGPDHKASLEPFELKSLVMGAREIVQALGDGRKQPTTSEKINMGVARKSIVAARHIRKGETFSDDNLIVRRPGTGVSPLLWDKVVNQVSLRDYEEGEQISI